MIELAIDKVQISMTVCKIVIDIQTIILWDKTLVKDIPHV